MKLVIDISDYNAEWIRNAYSIPQEINTNIAESIINAEPYSDWIPVTERLPEVGQRVLAQQKDGSSRACRCIDGGHLAWFYADTVAWMPLPEPYKGVTT